MTISYEKLEEVAYELNRRAAIAVPLDAREAFVKAAERETNPDAKRALLAVINNADTAVAEQSSMCGDTGCPRFYAKVGNEVKLEGGFVNLERALRAATVRASARPVRSISCWSRRARSGPTYWPPDITRAASSMLHAIAGCCVAPLIPPRTRHIFCLV